MRMRGPRAHSNLNVDWASVLGDGDAGFGRVEQAPDVVDLLVATSELADPAAEPVPLDELDDRGVLHHHVRHGAFPGEAPDGNGGNARAVGPEVDVAGRRRSDVIV